MIEIDNKAGDILFSGNDQNARTVDNYPRELAVGTNSPPGITNANSFLIMATNYTFGLNSSGYLSGECTSLHTANGEEYLGPINYQAVMSGGDIVVTKDTTVRTWNKKFTRGAILDDAPAAYYDDSATLVSATYDADFNTIEEDGIGVYLCAVG